MDRQEKSEIQFAVMQFVEDKEGPEEKVYEYVKDHATFRHTKYAKDEIEAFYLQVAVVYLVQQFRSFRNHVQSEGACVAYVNRIIRSKHKISRQIRQEYQIDREERPSSSDEEEDLAPLPLRRT